MAGWIEHPAESELEKRVVDERGKLLICHSNTFHLEYKLGLPVNYLLYGKWGIWQLVSTDPNNDKNPTRWLKVKPREGESTTLTLDINPKDLWASQGIFNFIGEFGDESGEKRTQGERVLELLRKYSLRGLEYQEIDRYLNVGKSLYTVLDRERRSTTDYKATVKN